METFSIKPRLYIGENPLQALSVLEGQRVMVVTDAFLATSGLLDRVRGHLSSCTVEIFDAVEPDPSLALVAQGIQRMQEVKPQAVVAFGGGSPMDCAKAMVYFAAKEGNGCLPLFCIPTTAGTGAELTSFAVLTDSEKGVKYPLIDDRLLPTAAILDPFFLNGLPPKVTADTGMDVLTHAAEALVAKDGNPFTKALAERAFFLAYKALPDAYHGESRAKETMLYASAMAGIAFNSAGLGICHAMAHAVGGRFHIPHGRINALLLPGVIAFNAGDEMAREAYAQLASVCGLAPNPRALSAALIRLRSGLGLSSRADVSATEFKKSLPMLAETARKDGCFASNPREPSQKETEGLIKGLLG